MDALGARERLGRVIWQHLEERLREVDNEGQGP